jgi:hypothetical protein
MPESKKLCNLLKVMGNDVVSSDASRREERNNAYLLIIKTALPIK